LNYVNEGLGEVMKTLVVMAILVTTAFIANAQKVQVGSDRSVDLTKYRTYAWEPQQGTSNPIIHQLIVDAVDQAMAAKGLRKVESDAEMLVVVLAATAHEMQMSYPSWSPGLNSIATGVAATSQTWPVTKGTLIVDISDRTTKNNLWRGTATHTLDNGPTGNTAKDAKGVEKIIKKAVDKMFKQYPYPPDK
jgi:hypothetical protein